MMNQMTTREAEQLLELCIGRIMRMGSRPAQPGDEAEYDRYRSLAIKAGEALYVKTSHYRGNMARRKAGE
jgi:hypothetical protein